MNRHVLLIALALAAVVPAACGSKGPPLPPLRPVPSAPTELAARRVGDRVTLRFVVPAASQDPLAPLTIARVEIYARTLPVGAEPPTLEQLVQRASLVGSVDVRPQAPAQTDGQPPVVPPAGPPDPRPAPGETAVWSETVTADVTSAMPLTRAQQARVSGRRTVWLPLVPSGLVVPFVPVTLPTRYYVAVGVSDRRRQGPASTVIAVPFGPAPEAPSAPALTYTESTLTLTWTTREAGAPVAVVETSRAGDERPAPVEVAPMTTGTWSTPVAFGVERCFVVRRVIRQGQVSTESTTAGPACETPVDKFPPPAPSGLDAVSSGGGEVTLLWDAVTAADLAGYHVLRGEGAGENMRQLTKEPVTALQWADTTTRTGVRYVYAVIAVDATGNPSALSNRKIVERDAPAGK